MATRIVGPARVAGPYDEHTGENKIRDIVDYSHAQKRDRRRERAMEHVRTAMSSGTLRLEPASPGPLPLDRLDAGEQLERIIECSHDLSEEHREVFSLRHFSFDGGRWDDIAEAMGRTGDGAGKATRTLYSRAVTSLLKNLSGRRNRSPDE